MSVKAKMRYCTEVVQKQKIKSIDLRVQNDKDAIKVVASFFYSMVLKKS